MDEVEDGDWVEDVEDVEEDGGVVMVEAERGNRGDWSVDVGEWTLENGRLESGRWIFKIWSEQGRAPGVEWTLDIQDLV